jgi:hypothetical protein
VLAFMIELDNKPGVLAKVAEAIAAKGVNITGVSGATCGDMGRMAIAVDNDDATRAALAAIGCKVQEFEVTTTTMRHAPGALAQATRRLADAGVNIESIMPLGMDGSDMQVGFVTSDPAAARMALSHASTGSL